MEELIREFKAGIRFLLLKTEMGLKVCFLFIRRIKVLMNSLIMLRVFGNNLMMKELFLFVIIFFRIGILLVAFNLFLVEFF